MKTCRKQRYLHAVIGLISVLLFFALWFFGSHRYTSFILPSPIDTFERLIQLFQKEGLGDALLLSARRAFYGFLLSLTIGTFLGILAGLSMIVRSAIKPLVVILMGVPPIAWIVLALLWFGLGDGTPIFTVFIATFPLLFTNALAGMCTQDPHLQTMCKVFGLSPVQRLMDLILPHLAAYIFPGAMIALASAWKVTMMAELLSASGGVGDQLAAARNTLDTAGVFALISMMTVILLIFEYVILGPIRKKIERWR